MRAILQRCGASGPRLRAFAVVATAAVMLSGCGESTSSAPDATSEPAVATVTASASSVETTTPTPSAAPLVLPSCDEMNAKATELSEKFTSGLPANSAGEVGEVDLTIFQSEAGPVAQAAMKKASQYRGCTWPIHLEGRVTEYVAELAQADQQELVDALKADSEVTTRTVGDTTAYTFVAESPGSSPRGVTNLFVDNVWISFYFFGGGWDVEQPALDAIYAKNPQLAP